MAAASVHVDVLGPVQVRRGDLIQPLGGRLAALLARLVIAGGRPVSLWELRTDVWDGRDLADSVVRVAISRLREVLGDAGRSATIVRHADDGYVLDLDQVDLDAQRFDRAVLRARRVAATTPVAALTELEAALGWWRGRAFGGLADESFVRATAARLEVQRSDALEHRLELLVGEGRSAEALPELHAAVASDPLREGLTVSLAVALYRAGQQTEALAVVRRHVRHLRVDLGLEPGPRIRELEHQLLTHDPGLSCDRRVATSPGLTPPTSRPTRFDHLAVVPLVGRDDELHALRRLVARHEPSPRLVIVEGPPGIGKTRLLVETARMGAAQGRTMVHVACGRDATSGLQLVADLRDALGMADRGTPTFDDAAVRRFTARQELRERLDVVGDVVVLADDLHWIDDESADLLVHLITRATSTRWVLALRSDPARPAARRLLDEIEREVRPDVLHPTPLAPGDIRRLADDLGITLDDPERDVERVADVSVGNPLLAVELLRAGGAIDPEGEVPDRVASLVGARLAEVDPLGRSLAAVVAVAGGATHRTTAGEVLGVEPREIDRTASSLREAGVLEGAPGGHLVIRHDLVRRAVLQRLDQSEVVRLRHDLVAALAPAGADDPAVAHHLFELGADRSDEQDDLLDLVVGRAVDELYAASDYGAAYELADRYLTEVGTVRTAHAATVTLLHVVTVLMGTGDPRAAALHRIVLERSSGLSDPRLRAGVLLASGPIETGAATSRDTIGEIVGLLDVLDPDDPRWVQLAAWAAHLHLNLGELEPATDLLRRAERHLAVRPRPAQEGLLLSLRVQATWLEASDDRGEALEQFSAHYHLTRDQISEAGLGLVALGRGFVDGTLDDVDDQRCALDRLARRVPRPDMRWWVHASSAAVLMARGDEHTAEAIATAEAAGAIGPVAIAGGTARLQQTWNTWQAGSLGGIAELVGRFAERPDPDAVALAVWAAALVQAGDAQQAAAVADRLVACHRPLRRAAMTWPVVAVLGAHVADATQHRALADVIGPALERRRGRGLAVHAAVYCGTADLALGLVRRAQGDLDEARTHWERATDLELVRGSTWWADHAAALLAEV